MSEKKRIYQIDLFRFLAALAVVLYHYTFRGYAADEMSVINFDQAGAIFKYGYLGVDLFFIISGFVILLSIKHNSIVKFIISRITRLYPVYWVAIFITFAITFLYGAPRYSVSFNQLLVNLTMFQNYLGVESIDGVYWSLFVEMKFYIFIIGSYLILVKIKPIKLDYLVLSWLALSVFYVLFNDLFITKILNYIFILNWSSYFIAGMLFYQIFTRGVKSKYLILLGVCLALSLINGIDKIEHLEEHYNAYFSPYVIGGIITLFYLLMFVVATGNLKRINSPKLLKLGMLTYPLYLIHQNIGFIIFNNLEGSVNKYVLLSGTILLMLVISYLISEFYEPKVSQFLGNKIKKLTAKYKMQ